MGREMNSPGRPRIMSVPIAAIEANPDNPRKEFNRLEELAASITAVGLVETPVVIEKAPNHYVLVSGERRWRAAQLAGCSSIEVIVRQCFESSILGRLHALTSNLQREDLSPFELASALRGIKEAMPPRTTNREIAQLLGRSEQWVGQVLRIDALPNVIRECVASAARKVPIDVLVEIARIKDPDEQIKLAKAAMTGATVQSFRRKLSTYREHGTQRRPIAPFSACTIDLEDLGIVQIWTYGAKPSVRDSIKLLNRAVAKLSDQ